MNDYMARVEQAVRDNLRGADVVALVQIEETVKQGYWERIYIVAWERPDQCGTHRVNINNKAEAACFIGHYDMTRDAAIADMIKRGKVAA
jgi:hypothetical protein